MNILLTDELNNFVKQKVASGAFSSEEAVLQEALRRLQREDQAECSAFDAGKAPTPEDLFDHEAIEYCSRELMGKDVPSLEDVRRILSKIPGSIAQAVVEERED
jgi:putative addiction module CopG family antidote